MTKKLFAATLFLLFKLEPFCQINTKPDLGNYFDSIKNKQNQTLGNYIKPFKEKLLTGKYFSEKQLKGKITLINFWFASCAPCIAEFPQLNLVHQKFKHNKNFQMLGITFEAKEEVSKIKNKYKITYPLLLTSRAKCSDLSFNFGYPVTIVTNYTGKIIYATFGGPTSKNEVEEKFNSDILPLINAAIQKNFSSR
jgi:thiol-disulfide isomerase/thioredoxin